MVIYKIVLPQPRTSNPSIKHIEKLLTFLKYLGSFFFNSRLNIFENG